MMVFHGYITGPLNNSKLVYLDQPHDSHICMQIKKERLKKNTKIRHSIPRPGIDDLLVGQCQGRMERNVTLMESFEKTQKNSLKRVPKRGHYDKATIYQVLDAGCLCHIGFVAHQQPYVIPTLYGRSGDQIYLHGATTSRLVTTLASGVAMCLTVTHVDGLVLARSAFHHAMNYRSVVVFGTAKLVEGEAEKNEALACISENIIPDRWEEARPPSAKELKGTTVLSVKIEEASAKIRTGQPIDDKQDYALPVWAGEIPLYQAVGGPVADPQLAKNTPVSPSVLAYIDKGRTNSQ